MTTNQIKIKAKRGRKHRLYLTRYSRFVSYKDLKAVVVVDLKRTYIAANENQAYVALLEFAKKWDKNTQ